MVAQCSTGVNPIRFDHPQTLVNRVARCAFHANEQSEVHAIHVRVHVRANARVHQMQHLNVPLDPYFDVGDDHFRLAVFYDNQRYLISIRSPRFVMHDFPKVRIGKKMKGKRD